MHSPAALFALEVRGVMHSDFESLAVQAEGYSKYPDEDGTPSGGVGTLMKEMSKTQRNAPGANPQFDFSKIFQ